MRFEEQPPGTYKVLRTDGAIIMCAEKPNLTTIRKAIGCKSIDTVILSWSQEGLAGTIMLVDDTGMLDEKPVNETATKLMRAIFGPEYPNRIHGDVAICNDGDF